MRILLAKSTSNIPGTAVSEKEINVCSQEPPGAKSVKPL
jgi:hypothetical protein